jgi:hypothetical protein
LGHKPARKRAGRVANPEYGEIEASIASLIQYFADSEATGESIARLRDKYGAYRVNRWIDVVSRIYGIAEHDLRTAFVVSQRKSWKMDVKTLFRRAFPRYANEYDNMDLALEAYVQYFLDEKRNNRLEKNAKNLREAHGGKVIPWIRAIDSVYRAADYDMRRAFGVSQEGGWRVDVRGLFRRTFPDIAADYDRWASDSPP